MQNVRVLPRGHAEPEIFVEPTGRFGDWREPLRVELPAGVERFQRRVVEVGLPFQLAATIAVEAALLLEDARLLAIAEPAARSALDSAAASPALPLLGARRANGGYLGLLAGGRGHEQDAPSEWLLLPARLHERVGALELERVFAPELVEPAVGWERAAVGSGRLLEEWGLLVLAGTLAQAPPRD